MYATYFAIVERIANKHGYALAIHGSFSRDMDMIAIPWVSQPSSHLTLLEEVFEMIGETNSDGSIFSSTEEKLHNRSVYTLPTGGGGYMDFSIMKIIN